MSLDQAGGKQDSLPQTDSRVIDLYKMAVEMADRVSARRSTANAFFLTAETAFVAVIGVATPDLTWAKWWITLSVSIAGLVMSLSWWLQLRSYRDLNRAKFDVINTIERQLPLKVFSDEWAILKEKSSKARRIPYAELGRVERIIPGIFAALYILLFIGKVVN